MVTKTGQMVLRLSCVIISPKYATELDVAKNCLLFDLNCLSVSLSRPAIKSLLAKK